MASYIRIKIVIFGVLLAFVSCACGMDKAGSSKDVAHEPVASPSLTRIYVDRLLGDQPLLPYQQKELDKVVAAAHERRAKLSKTEQVALDNELKAAFKSGDWVSYRAIQGCLDWGADPNYKDCFKCALSDDDNSNVAVLLWLYGARAKKMALLTRSHAIARLAIRTGAAVNEEFLYVNPLSHLFYKDGFILSPDQEAEDFSPKDLEMMLWLLHRDADPNSKGLNGAALIFTVIERENLVSLIALMQHGASLDKRFRGKTPLEFAELLTRSSEESAAVVAAYELLKTVQECKGKDKSVFDICGEYSLGEYGLLGISFKSAELIQEATHRVLDVSKRVDVDEVTSHGVRGISVTRFVHDRELGQKN